MYGATRKHQPTSTVSERRRFKNHTNNSSDLWFASEIFTSFKPALVVSDMWTLKCLRSAAGREAVVMEAFYYKQAWQMRSSTKGRWDTRSHLFISWSPVSHWSSVLFDQHVHEHSCHCGRPEENTDERQKQELDTMIQSRQRRIGLSIFKWVNMCNINRYLFQNHYYCLNSSSMIYLFVRKMEMMAMTLVGANGWRNMSAVLLVQRAVYNWTVLQRHLRTVGGKRKETLLMTGKLKADCGS